MLLDVSKEEEWIMAVHLIKEKYSKLDVLVNNAGVTNRSTIVKCELIDWEKVISVNQTGVFLGMKHCFELLKTSGKSSIINISSVSGLTGYFAASYTASKWAVRGLTKTAAMEFAEWGIRVNSVHPAYVLTPFVESIKEIVDSFNSATALERAAHPEEVVNGVLFLASDESSYMTGSELVIDGGMSAGSQIRRVAKELGIY